MSRYFCADAICEENKVLRETIASLEAQIQQLKEKNKKLAEASERVNYSTAAATHFMKRLYEIIASRKKAMNDQFQTINHFLKSSFKVM